MNHDDSFVMKLPITFPFLITRIILNQHHEVVHPEEGQYKNVGPFTLDYKMFVGTHVLGIIMTKHQGQVANGNSSPIFKATRKDVLLKLMEVSKDLQETNMASTIRKRNVDELIKMLTKEKEAEEEEEADSEEEDRSASEEDEESSED